MDRRFSRDSSWRLVAGSRPLLFLTFFWAVSARRKPIFLKIALLWLYLPMAVEKYCRRIRALGFVLSYLYVFAVNSAWGQARTLQSLLESTFSGTLVVAVVLDGKHGHLLSADHPFHPELRPLREFRKT